LAVFTWLVIAIEVISAIALVFLVLMHSGRGGGISDLLGGSAGSMAQGSTVVERNLDRVTIAVALVFAFATLTLDLRLQ
jgi:preprotein translocase subunit SecG